MMCLEWVTKDDLCKHLRLFEMVKEGGGSGLEGMKLEPSNKTLTQLQEVGQQRSLAFSADGTCFAAGGDVS